MQVHYCSSLISHRVGARYRPPEEREEAAAHVHNAPESRPEVIAMANARQQRLLAGFSWPTPIWPGR